MNCVYEREMLARRHTIRTKCETMPRQELHYSLTTFIDTGKLLVMPHRGLVWCPVFKAASTNWMINIPLLSNFTPKQLRVRRNQKALLISLKYSYVCL